MKTLNLIHKILYKYNKKYREKYQKELIEAIEYIKQKAYKQQIDDDLIPVNEESFKITLKNKNKLYECPYNKNIGCKMEYSCLGCEDFICKEFKRK